NLLRAIAANAEVGGFERRETLLPYVFASTFPVVGDRVAEEEDLYIASSGPLDKRVVPLQPPFLFPRSRSSRGIARLFFRGSRIIRQAASADDERYKKQANANAEKRVLG